MFESGILDVALGLTFVFILVSTLCSALREGVEGFLKTRAAYLEHAIRELLGDRNAQGLAPQFFRHPLINGLYHGDYVPGPALSKPQLLHRGRNLPSYIPARSFALALIDLVARGPSGPAADSAHLTLDALRSSVSRMQNPTVQRVMLSAIDSAQGDLDRVRQNLEAWYNGAMDRVSGWYKRSTQLIILGIALSVVCALNVNTITIADALYRNQALRSTVVASAQHSSNIGSYDDALQAFDRMRLPMGWSDGWGAPRNAHEQAMAKTPIHPLWNDVFGPVLGLLLTAFAAMLGAPFWFDVLNKIMVVRATVKPHQKSLEEPSDDRVLPPSRPMQLMAASPGFVPKAEPQNQNDVSGCVCDGPVDEPTPDEELPQAKGGVG